jgi:hypothetical protein
MTKLTLERQVLLEVLSKYGQVPFCTDLPEILTTRFAMAFIALVALMAAACLCRT